jgi:hypothetical protein
MERAMQRIIDLDPGLWKTAQDIAREALGIASRWRGKSKTGVNLAYEEVQVVLKVFELSPFERESIEGEEALWIKLIEMTGGK